MTIEQKIDKVYDELFAFICKQNEDLYDLTIEYQELTTGKTVRRSWRDRDERLREEEK